LAIKNALAELSLHARQLISTIYAAKNVNFFKGFFRAIFGWDRLIRDRLLKITRSEISRGFDYRPKREFNRRANEVTLP
jgi:hypothetical protein